MSSSGVMMVRPWIMAWQISMRSNVSLCNWGSRVKCNVALSSKGRVSTPCCSLWPGMNLSGDSGRGSRPRACLMEISQVETELRKTSFAGSWNSSRAPYFSPHFDFPLDCTIFFLVERRTFHSVMSRKNIWPHGRWGLNAWHGLGRVIYT